MRNFYQFVLIFFILTTSLNAYSKKFTEENGRLKLVGKQLCNEEGKPIQLRGFNTYNMTYCPECVTFEAVKSNRKFWGANVIRATVYVDDFWNDQTYNNNPELSKKMVDDMVNWTEKIGMYCIIDWHILKKGNPNDPDHAGADDFFRELSIKYADKKHIIWEICNEPNGDDVSWDIVADYANRIIPIIRENDPESVIIVGSPQWSLRIDKVNPELLNDTYNIMYAFHFYAASHIDALEILKKEIHRIPVFASEWGPCECTGNGNLNFNNTDAFLDVMKQHVEGNDTVSISWAVFSYADVDEAASLLKPNSCKIGKWENMSPTGYYIRERLMQK